MIITYHGGAYCRVSHGNITIATNPISKNSRLKSTKGGSDIVLVSLQDPDFNGIEQVTHGDKIPFCIEGPGEYEVKDIFIKGFQTNSLYGAKVDTPRINTVFLLNMEGISILVLGALSDAKLAPSILEEIDRVDVLITPIGGNGVLSSIEAHKLGVSLDAKIIIPTLYDTPSAEKVALSHFLKEAGVEYSKPQEKLILKKKDVEMQSGSVVVLSS